MCAQKFLFFFIFIKTNLAALLFWQNRQKKHQCFDAQMHSDAFDRKRRTSGRQNRDINIITNEDGSQTLFLQK